MNVVDMVKQTVVSHTLNTQFAADLPKLSQRDDAKGKGKRTRIQRGKRARVRSFSR